MAPLLFLFYSNDLSENLSIDADIALFADDIFILTTARKKECTENCAFSSIVAYRLQNPKNITIDHLNVNLLRSKIETVDELIKKIGDICLLFSISNYKSLCRDRNKHGRGLYFYINENIPWKVMQSDLTSQNEDYFLNIFSQVLNKLSCQYNNIMLIRDLTKLLTAKIL